MHFDDGEFRLRKKHAGKALNNGSICEGGWRKNVKRDVSVGMQ